jgi:hypothetical protein
LRLNVVCISKFDGVVKSQSYQRGIILSEEILMSFFAFVSSFALNSTTRSKDLGTPFKTVVNEAG